MYPMNSIYDLNIEDLQGNVISMENFKSKVLMVVNTASHCGFTPQLGALQSIYQQYRDQGFEILAMPCNDFQGQEPLDGSQLEQFCTAHFQTTFPLSRKIHVKGKNIHPVFRFLIQQLGAWARPRWNFYKYLIDRNGNVVTFFFTFTKPDSWRVRRTIQELLRQ